jgi:hypothetical protein
VAAAGLVLASLLTAVFLLPGRARPEPQAPPAPTSPGTASDKLTQSSVTAASPQTAASAAAPTALDRQESAPSPPATVPAVAAPADVKADVVPSPPPAAAPDRKAVARTIEAGVAWIVKQLRADGGWCEGPEKESPGNCGASVSNVAHTSLSTLALLRAGNGTDLGPHARNVARAVDFVCGQVEKSDATSLKVATVEGTHVQFKLGPVIDSYLALRLLAELRGRMPDEKSEKRVGEALAKLIAKLERNQRPDGSWPHEGRTTPLALTLITQGLLLAREGGVAVDAAVVRKANRHALESLERGAAKGTVADATKGTVITTSLAGSGGFFGALHAVARDSRLRERRLRATLDSPSATEAERDAARSELNELAGDDKRYEVAVAACVKYLNDPDFGLFMDRVDYSGGEEYLTFLFITELLAARGGKDWDVWRGRVTRRVLRQQHADGSWSAQHCLCGGSFCTPAALLVLQADPASRKAPPDEPASGGKDR